MIYIQSYTVETNHNEKRITGTFNLTGGEFIINYSGDGGNADTYEITIWGGQYDISAREPLNFTITGAWEIREVIEMFQLLGTVDNPSTKTP